MVAVNNQTENFSFEALTDEMGDIALPVQPQEPEPDPNAWIPVEDMGGTCIVDEEALLSKPRKEDPNLHVLTGCSPKPRPLWIDGLMSNALAFLFIAPIMLGLGLRQYQPWISHMAALLALGAGLWSLYGLRIETETTGKRMCWISAGLSLVVMLAAFLVRAPMAQ